MDNSVVQFNRRFKPRFVPANDLRIQVAIHEYWNDPLKGVEGYLTSYGYWAEATSLAKWRGIATPYHATDNWKSRMEDDGATALEDDDDIPFRTEDAFAFSSPSGYSPQRRIEVIDEANGNNKKDKKNAREQCWTGDIGRGVLGSPDEDSSGVEEDRGND